MRELLYLTPAFANDLVIKLPFILARKSEATKSSWEALAHVVPDKDLGVVLLKWPRLLMLPAQSLNRNFESLTVTLQVSKAVAKRVVAQNPLLLFLSPATQTRRLQKFQDVLESTTEDTVRIVLRAPHILCYNDKQLPSTCAHIAAALGIDKSELRPVLKSFPQLLGYNPKTHEAKMQALGQLLTLTRAECSALVRRSPRLLSVPVATLADAISCLRQALQLTDAEIVKLVRRAPGVLTLSSSAIAQKLHGFSQLFEVPLSSIKNVVLSCPHLLQRSPQTMQSTWKLIKEAADSHPSWQRCAEHATLTTRASWICYSRSRTGTRLSLLMGDARQQEFSLSSVIICSDKEFSRKIGQSKSKLSKPRVKRIQQTPGIPVAGGEDGMNGNELAEFVSMGTKSVVIDR